jgi:hypothetical protein
LLSPKRPGICAQFQRFQKTPAPSRGFCRTRLPDDPIGTFCTSAGAGYGITVPCSIDTRRCRGLRLGAHIHCSAGFGGCVNRRAPRGLNCS